MVRLTAQLINMSAQKHNPVRDWELDLRGYRIPVIENVGATLDQFDTIDFTDNDIRRLDKFPLLKRLKHILLSNNRIVRISENLQETLPSLETLILTKNCIKELADIDPLGTITTLKYLSILDNPVVTKKNYRLYVIHKVPSLRVLDFSRIKQKERQLANKLFKKKKAPQPSQAAATVTENGDAKTFVPGEMLESPRVPSTGPSKQDVAAIRKAIANAQSLEEIERLNQLLKSGHIPGREEIKAKPAPPPAQSEAAMNVEEEEEEEEEEDEEEAAAVAEEEKQDQAAAPSDSDGNYNLDEDTEEEEEEDGDEEEEMEDD